MFRALPAGEREAMNWRELEIGSHDRVRNGRGESMAKHVAVVVIFGVGLPNYPHGYQNIRLF